MKPEPELLRFAEVVAEGRAETRSGDPQTLSFLGDAAVGDFVGLADGRVKDVLGHRGSARASLYALAAEEGLNPYFSEAVVSETRRHLDADAVNDPRLNDLTELPFVTIDGASSRDLDQALFVERDGTGFVLHYALADAAYFVERGSALFRDALARGASYYFPGFAIPMLPRALSEGLVSLNPDGPRRALVFRVWLDGRGERLRTEVRRGRIHSRRKLAWGEVQALYDAEKGAENGAETGDAEKKSPLAETPFAESLLLLRELGELLLDRAESRDLVRYHREEVDVSLDDAGMSFVVTRAVRDRIELYNEQISLLVNGEGARLLREHPSGEVEPIYRIHPAPDPERLRELRTTLEAVARHHHLPESFVWKEGSSLARYIAVLPAPVPHGDPSDPQTSVRRVARALERQAIVANMRSHYAIEPGEHFGVGLDPYGRFTAPMREIVGVFLHGETVEAFGLGGPKRERDPELREAVVVAGNRARDLQRKIADAGNRLVIDRLFRADLLRPLGDRPFRLGTVMGISHNKVHVSLDQPPLDLKLYLRELGKVLGGVWLAPSPDGVSLLEEKTGKAVFSVGEAIELRVVDLDRSTDRWVLSPRRA